ncbi:MAG TPA: RagB/SusD family nutrient uptake outer membrane protein [Arenibacter sp.]|nr:RagB/SusD family nutrient uptake outer membrane protein [Arenibacter sp.]
MKEIHIYLSKKYLVIFCALFFCNCDDFVEVDLPNSQLTGEAVFTDSASARAALGDVYAELRDNVLVTGTSNGLGVLMGLYTDELEFYGSTTLTGFEFFNHTLLATNPNIAQLWNNAFQSIYAVNSVHKRVGESQLLSILDKEQFQGEALFLRAYLHFYLTQLFGDIPYVTSTDYVENSQIPKVTKKLVLAKIVEDLKMAKQFLFDKESLSDRTQIDVGAVSAFLARCYLYRGEWELANKEASVVIGNTAQYIWEENLNKVFLKESTGTIWQLSPHVNGNSTHEARSFVFVSGPPPNRALSEYLVRSFETGDLRREQWIGTVTNGMETWYHANKYKQHTQQDSSAEYSILFRLAEQYLIRAEARAQLNNLEGAKADLDMIRERAQLPGTTAIDQEEVLDAILKERRVELFTEQGHRWFDLVRYGKADAVLSPIKAGWRTTDVLLPLPEVELLLNPNIDPQNDGY